ncbi:uncharacterized protein [Engystomops pustulosus]|uniref:uncharacterized protein isoform X1 n=1 Tax=Engystomops pustulosus TaxID=76066 RepID=UPI003AFA7589
MAEVAALLSQLRALAAAGGPELRKQVLEAMELGGGTEAAEGSGGGTAAQATGGQEAGVRRSRRSRPPDRLSPEATPRTRRRVRSPSRDPPARGAGSGVGNRRSRAERNPGTDNVPRPAQNHRPGTGGSGRRGDSLLAIAGPPTGDVPVGGGACVTTTAVEDPGVTRGPRSGAARSAVAWEGAGRRGGESGTAPAVAASAVAGSSSTACLSCCGCPGASSHPSAESSERSVQRLENIMAAGGHTAPMRHGESVSVSVQLGGLGSPRSGVSDGGNVEEMRSLMGSMRELLARCEGSIAGASPVTAWLP